tara:strand:- start:1130 stop:1537 length:408 start_codon:yes stop_codon:yes gene_type:complete
MGYTNYWECETDFTDDEWKAICEEAQYIKEIDSSYQENMFRTLDGVDILENEICFNGVADLGCETFYLNRKATDFSFCKTREMPYDIYVWHLLTFCQMIKKDFHARRDRWYWDKSKPLPKALRPQKQIDRSGAVV